MENEAYKIIRLEAENIKRLTAVRITPKGDVIVLGGKNGAGKSSVLDAIMYALAGKRAVCEKPVRDGESKAKVTVDLGDYVVTRTFTEAGGGTLTINGKDGSSLGSPQAVLDGIVGSLSFDPLSFLSSEPREQARILKDLAGLNFSKKDAERQKAYDERTAVGRDLARANAVAEKMAFHGDLEKPEDIGALKAMLSGASERAASAAKAKGDVESSRARLDRAEKALRSAQKEVKDATKALETAEEAVKGLEAGTVSVQDIQAKIDAAEACERKRQENLAKERAQKEARELQAKVDALTKKIERIDQDKADAISEAKFPIKGLAVSDDGVLFNGVPFAQASFSARLKVSAAIGMALNPKLRVLLVREASMLDEESLGELLDMAEANDVQIWIERVGKGKEVGIVIEDGEISEIR